MNEVLPMAKEIEATREKTAMVLGRLDDLGLGNAGGGIPSSLAEASSEALDEQAEHDLESLVDPTDLSCTACIDGRPTKCNADGSAPEIRLRHAGGTLALDTALNSDASIVDTFDDTMSIGHQTHLVDELIGGRSAHLGGCGAANGEIIDNRAINENPKLLAAAKVLMEIPEVKDYFGIDYSDELGERVRENAAKTADYLESKGWDGQKYVDGVVSEYPENVEDLEVDENDHEFHGHRESRIIIVIGDKTVAEDNAFVWNLKATKDIAEKLAGQRGKEGYQQALIADIAKHLAVSSRLAHTQTPVELLVA